MRSLTPEEALGDLERGLGGGEEQLVAAAADPERPADAARQEQRLRAPLVEPRSRHRAAELLQSARSALVRLREREDGLRVDRHLGLGTLEAMLLHQLVVVEDDPVVDADDRSVPDRVVVGLDPGVTLCVVTHVDQCLGRTGGEHDLFEERARPGALLVDRGSSRPAPVGVPDRVGAALGDPGEQGLGRERPVERARRAQAVSGYSAHNSRRPLAPDERPQTRPLLSLTMASAES